MGPDTGSTEQDQSTRSGFITQSVFGVHSEFSRSALIAKARTEEVPLTGALVEHMLWPPRFGETVEQASRRRLFEEMGFDTELRKLFDFTYYAKLDEGLIEHEFDHVLIGRYEDMPQPNADEVMEWRWANLALIREDLEREPHLYTYWFRVSFDPFLQAIAVSGNE